MLSELGRRVLAHLPVWAEDEDAFVELEGGPEVSIRSYNLADFTQRLHQDANNLGNPSQQDVRQWLEELVKAGYAEEGGDEWWMTKEGFDALHAPRTDRAPDPGGPIILDLQPASSEGGLS